MIALKIRLTRTIHILLYQMRETEIHVLVRDASHACSRVPGMRAKCVKRVIAIAYYCVLGKCNDDVFTCVCVCARVVTYCVK